MKYSVTAITSLVATIVAARESERAPPAATDNGNIMSRVLALENILEEQRVQLEKQRMHLENVSDVVSSLHSRKTQTSECFETKGKKITFKCNVVMKKKLVVSKDFTVKKGDSLFEGGNVFINNGAPISFGDGDNMNGKGNLIVGGKSADVQANPGSHNVIIGLNNTYSSIGGLVAGYNNEISGHFASVTGGTMNIASGHISSISGGARNKATATGSSVYGGTNGQANGLYSSVSGGSGNEANGLYASVTGGTHNKAAGQGSSIGGGSGNQTPYKGSVVTGTQFKSTEHQYDNVP
mmetsp:Transcript_25815/g.29746  ORF Transcript_25815/g.29746 Transcript_25815/m.29746 type:complete len:295 (+) Transcript_25815:17-901(+)